MIIAMLNASSPSSSADSPRRARVKSLIGMDYPVLCRIYLPCLIASAQIGSGWRKNSIHPRVMSYQTDFMQIRARSPYRIGGNG